jgi:hypothetical protein
LWPHLRATQRSGCLRGVAKIGRNDQLEEKVHNRLASWCWMLMALAVSACDQQFRLIGSDGLECKGTLTIHLTPPHDMAVAIRGEQFFGQWRSAVVDEGETIRRSYGSSGLTYEHYRSGHWTGYLRHGHATLQGSEGTTMECDFDYRGEGDGAGDCADSNGGKYHVIL